MAVAATHRQGWSPFAPICAVALAASWFSFSYGYIEDDSYIHLEFARSLAAGQGYAFNGHLVNGDTAPLWPLLLAGLHLLGVGWIAAAKLLCLAGLASTVSSCWQLAHALSRGQIEAPVFPLAAVLVTVVNPFFAHWVFAGMESVTALGLSFWVIRLVYLEQPTAWRAWVAALLLGLGPLLRPELLLLGAIAGPSLLLHAWRMAGNRSHPQRLLLVIALGLLMVLPLGSWCAYAQEAFGAIVPNTNLAKRGGSLTEVAPRLVSVYALGYPVTLLLLPLAAVLQRRIRSAPVAIWVLLFWPLMCVAFYLLNHTALQTRYCLLSMPSMAIAMLWFLYRTRRPVLFAGAVAATLLSSVTIIGLIVIPHIANKEEYSSALAEVAAYIHRQLPAQAPVAVYAIGQIAFQSQHPLIDIGGITDNSVIPYLGNPEGMLRWARDHGARYYVGSTSPVDGAERLFVTTVPFIGWSLHPSQYRVRQQLAVYRLP